ncbi:hypothetical protein MPSI1_003302 [Malassezia psittaci]|uniref:PQ loop repeat protein n=1 Tax=Malassezia psittaci TaxID=1821823 RepID=A0AAF0FHH7_9BASI|nr:hypothetical protein MPSI1_003302 [Malassezia psittaci]
MWRKDSCEVPENRGAFLVAGVVCVGVVLSYLPQIVRIYRARSSVGLSPWFLFLGATSSACAMFNVMVLQWPILRCCSRLRAVQCLEQMMGVLQVSLQWFMFSVIFAMFLTFYKLENSPFHRERQLRKHNRHTQETQRLNTQPEEDAQESSGSESDLEQIQSHIHQSYGGVSEDVGIRPHETHADRNPASYINIPRAMRRILEDYHLPGDDQDINGSSGTEREWRLSKTLAWITLAQCVVCAMISVLLLAMGARHCMIQHWTRFLGLTGTFLAVLQYLPQIFHTARAKLVRSLSIPMMLLQVPGTVLFVYALAAREGVNWTSLLAYIAAGCLQAMLLILCICWKVRQARLHIDDYGRPL